MPLEPTINAALSDLFEKNGHETVEPPVLQPADVFLDLAGEDIRRRLFLTTGEDGRDICLRPDFTIPVSRLYLQRGKAGRAAKYSYNGLIFRQRPGHSGEIPQAGAEILGMTEREQADAQILILAQEAAKAAGQKEATIRIGDEAVFTALLEALGLPIVWRRRLRDLFGERERLDKAIARMAGDGRRSDENMGFLAALEGADPDAAVTVVEDLLSIAGISTVGGRTAHEISERFLEQAALASGVGVSQGAADTLTRFLNISGPADQAVEKLSEFALSEKLNLSVPLERFERRIDLLRAGGIEPKNLSYAADFGRRLDYYTGFVFELHNPHDSGGQPVIGGGRYDLLVRLLGAEKDVPAVGFSMWLDRMNEKG
ncbi:MAG: ATP phosphoribosyltransferase regulatory subunit [Stappiaceae bacterium]